MEIWKSINNYPNYEISNLGRIKSLERYVKHSKKGLRIVKEKILKTPIRNGYFYIELYDINGISKKHNIHRLLAVAFIPNPDNLPIVEHLNDIKTDIRLENLVWSTLKSNSNRCVLNNRDNPTTGEKHGLSKLTEKQVLEIRKIGRTMSESKIGLIYGVERKCINNILNRKSWRHI